MSLVDLCVDVAGWEDIERLDRVQHFISRSRKRSVHDESAWVGEVRSRDYSLGLRRTGFEFARDSKGSSALSCRMYNKSLELEKSGKDWFMDLWRAHGWSEEDGEVWRVGWPEEQQALVSHEEANVNESRSLFYTYRKCT